MPSYFGSKATFETSHLTSSQAQQAARTAKQLRAQRGGQEGDASNTNALYRIFLGPIVAPRIGSTGNKKKSAAKKVVAMKKRAAAKKKSAPKKKAAKKK